MKRKNAFLALALVLFVVPFLTGQVARQSGVIRGIITDAEGNPLPGMTVTAKSPALLGTITDVTNAEGSFRLPGLPPGTYTVTAELSGFKSIRQDGIIVQVGQILTLSLKTEPSALQEEITVVATSPTVDVQSTKVGGVVTTQMMQQLPLSRNLTNIFFTVPGSAGAVTTYSGSIHGATDTTITFEVDGVNSNDPTHNGLLLAPQYDAMEEIEVSTGGLPAQFGNTGGSFVNIVTKSGGNDFHGQLQVYYTEKSLNEILFTDEQMRAMGIGKPSFAITDLDASAILGGPIIRDKVWFFSTFSLKRNEYPSVFIPTTIQGKSYEQYPDPQTQWETFFKATAQLSKNFRVFGMFSGMLLDRDVYGGGGTRTAYDATFTLNNNTWVSTTGNATWLLSPNTFIDIRGGYVNRWYPIQQRDEFADNTTFTDSYTGYTWNGIPTWESYITRRTHQASARLTHFQDDFLGGDHEIGLGIEYQRGMDRYEYARENPITWYYYNGNPYYYRGLHNLTGPHSTFGDGYLAFTNCGQNSGDSWNKLLEDRYSAYFQDSLTIKNRLSINLGLRFDYYDGFAGEATSTGITGLPFQIGEVLKPQLEALHGAGKGFNPFGQFSLDPIKGAMKFSFLSPRLGFTYDPFGRGKTALKASISRYGEAVPVRWFDRIAPAVMQRYWFNWWDLNKNGQPDSPGVDRYDPTSGLGIFALPDPEYLRTRVDPDMGTPWYWEFVASINHELFRDFAVKAQYLYKRGYDGHGFVNYDKATGRYWYKLEEAPEWWVPFKTTVPAYGNYPAKEVTVYGYTLNSPWNNQFSLANNLSEYKSIYNGVELTFDKRYSDGWSLGGSVVFSRHDVWGGGGDSNSLTSPNSFINAYGRSPWDVPLNIKLYGTFSLPYGLTGSFFLRHSTGTPYLRNVSIAIPTAWAAKNNVYPASVSVNLEERGARRNQSFDNLDVRLEKEFTFSFGKLGIFADVYNLLANQYVTVGQNPGGTWRPTDNNVTTGSYTVASTYGKVTGLSGVRTFKFSARFIF